MGGNRLLVQRVVRGGRISEVHEAGALWVTPS
jgi:hypothetical protein